MKKYIDNLDFKERNQIKRVKMENVMLETYGSSQKYHYEFKEEKSRYVQRSDEKSFAGQGIFKRLKEIFKV